MGEVDWWGLLKKQEEEEEEEKRKKEEEEEKKKQKEKENEDKKDDSVFQSDDKANDKKRKSDDEETTQPKLKKQATDDPSLEENLMCGICQDILYKPVSLLDCLHTFCCACVHDWLERSKECPECRQKVKSVNKNHIVANLIDNYLTKFPKKRRDQKEMDEMDLQSFLPNITSSPVISTFGKLSINDMNLPHIILMGVISFVTSAP